MNRVRWYIGAMMLAVVWATGLAAQNLALSAERLDDRWIIRIDDRVFTVYRFGGGQKYPYFYPVNGPLSGRSLTAECETPYPHHRSLFFGCDKVNGGNYWQEGNEQGQIVSRGPRLVYAGPERIVLQDTCDWQRPGEAPILRDRRMLTFSAPSASLRFIDVAITLDALVDIHIEKTNHSLFSARMAPELSVQSGGVLRNAQDARGEKNTYGVPSPWCDYSGRRCEGVEGLAIFDSPQNPWHPSPWFTRDYGFFSPTPMYWLTEAGFSIKRGDSLTVRYRVVVHSGDTQTAGIGELYEQWINAAGSASR